MHGAVVPRLDSPRWTEMNLKYASLYITVRGIKNKIHTVRTPADKLNTCIKKTAWITERVQRAIIAVFGLSLLWYWHNHYLKPAARTTPSTVFCFPVGVCSYGHVSHYIWQIHFVFWQINWKIYLRGGFISELELKRKRDTFKPTFHFLVTLFEFFWSNWISILGHLQFYYIIAITKYCDDLQWFNCVYLVGLNTGGLVAGFLFLNDILLNFVKVFS